MPAVAKIVLLAVVLIAAAYDLRFRRIPNWLSVSGVIAGFVLNTTLSGRHGLAAACLGFLCAFLVYVPLYLVRAMGAGDVKLMGAVGAIVGAGNWVGIFFITAIIGGVVSLILIASQKRLYRTLSNLTVIGAELLHFRMPFASEKGLDIRNSEALGLPHAAVIAAGSIVFLLHSTYN